LSHDREKILVVDDEPGTVSALETILGDDYLVFSAETGAGAWQILQEEEITVALVDLKLPDLEGLEILSRLRAKNFETELVMITGKGSVDTAVEAMRRGAYDYLLKPLAGARIKEIVAKALEKYRLQVANLALRSQIKELTHYEELIGQSEVMREVYRLIEAVAKTDSTILITGESGTGKELVARAIHRRSNRSAQAFVATNCSALPSDILENEMFGHEKGAFTGALMEKPGCFEQADHGTMFFDEIGEMPYELQAKLLRALEERKFRRLGGRKEISVDVRIISATNCDVRAAVREKILREDLFYRLAVVEIELPPLRERLSDLATLAENFLKRYAEKNSKKITGVSREAFELLSRHNWPGNVRELRNVVERAVILCTGRMITPLDLPKYFHHAEPANTLTVPLGTTVEDAERLLIMRTLESHHNNKTRAAETLGISLKTLHNKLERYREETPG